MVQLYTGYENIVSCRAVFFFLFFKFTFVNTRTATSCLNHFLPKLTSSSRFHSFADCTQYLIILKPLICFNSGNVVSARAFLIFPHHKEQLLQLIFENKCGTAWRESYFSGHTVTTLDLLPDIMSDCSVINLVVGHAEAGQSHGDER